MKRLIITLFILGFATPSIAATVGSPEITIPEQSLYLKREAVNKTLDRYEYNMDIKGSVEGEIIFDRQLTSAPGDIANAKIEGQNYMFKLSTDFYDLFEPYIKIGTSDLEVSWEQHGKNVTVDSDTGFTWGAGVKAKLWEFKDYGVKLTLDAQYRNFNLDVDEVMIGSETTETADATNETFEIKEWQTSLLASKRFILPIGLKDYYIVPYTGITYSSIDVDASFTKSTNGILYSTYNASDENVVGLVFGCDIMPSLLSWYLFNFELRLINETAFSFGGTIKF